MTLAAGVQWDEAYATVNDHGRLMVGAFCYSVGSSGGWLAGGGHSALSPSYGLGKILEDHIVHQINRPIEGVDNALEISVVLSTGEFLTVNNYQYSDLFWALRGGGGFTYGIVTSVTYRTYPSVPTQLYTYQANITNSSVLPELVGGLLRYQTQFTDDGWGGYGNISDQQLSFYYFAPNMTNETAVATTQAWHNYTASLAPFGVVSEEQTYYYPSWYEVYQILSSNAIPSGVNVMITSRLLSRGTVANHYAEVAEVLLNCSAGFAYVLLSPSAWTSLE